MNGHCEFFQQNSYYADKQKCLAVVMAKHEEYAKMGATVDSTCIEAIVQKRGLYES
jgi:ribonuclease I